MLYARNNSATKSYNPDANVLETVTNTEVLNTLAPQDHCLQHNSSGLQRMIQLLSVQSAPALPYNEIEIPCFWKIFFFLWRRFMPLATECWVYCQALSRLWTIRGWEAWQMWLLVTVREASVHRVEWCMWPRVHHLPFCEVFQNRYSTKPADKQPF